MLRRHGWSASIGLIIVMLATLLPLSVSQAQTSSGPDLVLTFSDVPERVMVDARVTVTITVTNAGDVAGDAHVSIAYANRLDPVSTRPSQGSCHSSLGCSLGPIPVGATATITLVVQLYDQSPARTEISANSGSYPSDIDQSNNSASATIRWVNTQRASEASDDTQGDGPSAAPSISDNGRFVVFHSEASNLVPNDTNGLRDIFLHDRITDTTTRISVAGDGSEANGASANPVISQDGQYVAYQTFASNLVPDDTNGVMDIIRYSRASGASVRVSVSATGEQANGPSRSPAISFSLVVFASDASNLVADDTNGKTDIFLYGYGGNREVQRVSVATDGAQGNGPSANPDVDGAYIVFQSLATNLVSNDTNGKSDIFAHHFYFGIIRTTRISQTLSSSGALIEGDGASVNPAVIMPPAGSSSDIYTVAFESTATNLVPNDTNGKRDIFTRTIDNCCIRRVSMANGGGESNGHSRHPVFRYFGDLVVYESDATNLVAGDTNGVTDIFQTRYSRRTKRLSSAWNGAQLNGRSGPVVAVSRDGTYMVFPSKARNVVPGDTNWMWDIFVKVAPVR